MLFHHLCGSSLDSLQAPSVPRRLWNPELSDDLSPFHLLSCGGSCGFGLSCDLDCTQLGVNMFHASGASLLIAISYRMRYIMDVHPFAFWLVLFGSLMTTEWNDLKDLMFPEPI